LPGSGKTAVNHCPPEPFNPPEERRVMLGRHSLFFRPLHDMSQKTGSQVTTCAAGPKLRYQTILQLAPRVAKTPTPIE
jgi:hypothetical protein